MVMLALLLVLATGGFGAVGVVENLSRSSEYAVEIFGHQIATLTAPGHFLSGVALTLIFCLGPAVLVAGSKRHRRMHEAHVRTGPRVAGAGSRHIFEH